VKPRDEAQPSAAPFPWWQTPAEVACLFAVFFLQGAWPVPDVNEAYYLGKAIHFWNPAWIPGDFFLDTADTHWTFYFTFGWLSLVLSPQVLAWVGRLLTWALLAWSWQRLSLAILNRRWFSVLSGALAACLLDRCTMAGEWVIGGVEAKGFAYVLVFLGLEALAAAAGMGAGDASPQIHGTGWKSMVQNPWNRVWILFGGAGFFHVLVGGWAAVAAGFAWLTLADRPSLRSMWPGLAAGLLLALPSLYPSARLDVGVPPEIVRRAHEIYVFERLYHHLDLQQIPPLLIFRFTVLITVFGVLAKTAPEDRKSRAVTAFVVGSLAIALLGGAIDILAPLDRPLAAGLLRFYWFRLSDVAVPVGVSLLGIRMIDHLLTARPAWGRVLLGLALLAAAIHVGGYALRRPFRVPPRSDQWVNYVAWRRACQWIAESGRIAADARFLTPRNNQTFKWYSHRAEVANWKEIPQDAASMVAWWDRLKDIYGSGSSEEGMEWYGSLNQLGAARLKELGAKYGADYLLTEGWLRLPLQRVYPLKRVKGEKSGYVIYRLK
jgi:hypothetical protein